MGWTMNDLRSRNRTLAPVPSIGPQTGEIVSSRPSSRPRGNPLFQSSRPLPDDGGNGGSGHDDAGDGNDRAEADEATEATLEPEPEERLTFKVSRELRTMPVTAVAESEQPIEALPGNHGVDKRGVHETGAESAQLGDDEAPAAEDDPISDRARTRRRKNGLASRPTKRREVYDAEEVEDDKFPWHYQFEEDEEPEELQAKSPLLSRAFRSSVG